MRGVLIGGSLKHSYSPLFYVARGQDYVLLEKKNIGRFINEKDYDFVNITSPFKKKAIKYLNYKSDLVKATGVCNLIVNRAGFLMGYNTDVDGFYKLLQKSNVDVEGKTVLILGNGATKNTLVYCLKNKKAKKIIVACREKRQKREYYFDEVPKDDVQIIINATPVGQKLNDKKLVTLSDFPKLDTVIDLIYNPSTTNLLYEAKKLKLRSSNGLSMLSEQARRTLEVVTGEEEDEEIWDALKASVAFANANIIFIGPPASGKTTYKNIFKNMSKDFPLPWGKRIFDTDSIISKKAKMSISQYIETYGEQKFREEENKVVDSLYKKQSSLIALGGGTLLNEENYRKLSYHGKFVYLKRTNYDNYKNDPSRPLCKTKKELIKLVNERKDMYENWADIVTNSEIEPTNLVMEVLNALADC